MIPECYGVVGGLQGPPENVRVFLINKIFHSWLSAHQPQIRSHIFVKSVQIFTELEVVWFEGLGRLARGLGTGKWARPRSSSLDFIEICGCSADVVANHRF